MQVRGNLLKNVVVKPFSQSKRNIAPWNVYDGDGKGTMRNLVASSGFLGFLAFLATIFHFGK
jgi:hypothetical protein